ncbi:MAG TPA: OmpH family outer membrane protein [Caulobacteraceae bacterium]|nr:OmpH family outer membrane protein [Caulobacteraceae bacterium]
MTPRNIFAAGAALSAALSLASATLAQGAHASGGPPAQTPITHGPPIAGFCVFSSREIIAKSKVGQSVGARLKVLSQQVSAELQPEADAINNERRTLESQASTMDQATLQARQANWQLRVTNFEKREQQRSQEMQATQQKQFAVIMKELDPILSSLYQQNRCSVLIDGDTGGVVVLNPAMDLSTAAVAQLDVKLQTLTFDREHLDQPAGAGAPAN